MPPLEKLNIIVADHQDIFIDGLKVSLKRLPETGKVFSCTTIDEIKNQLRKPRISLLILEIAMPNVNGVEITKWIRLNYPDIAVVILTTPCNTNNLMQLYDIGIKGYLCKNSKVSELQYAFRKILAGGSFFCQEVQNLLFANLLERHNTKQYPNNDTNKLSDRECDVLRLICEQFSSEEIADKLFLSPLTVKRHRQIIMQKTGSKNLAGLVVYAIKKDIYVI